MILGGLAALYTLNGRNGDGIRCIQRDAIWRGSSPHRVKDDWPSILANTWIELRYRAFELPTNGLVMRMINSALLQLLLFTLGEELALMSRI
jgi:hypothetical protein